MRFAATLIIAALAACGAPDTAPGGTPRVGGAERAPDPSAVQGRPALAEGSLFTEGNRIYVADGAGSGVAFKGRGANVHDTRSCWACTYEEPNVGEVTRRIDVLVDAWGADFVRIVMEAETDDASAPYARSFVADPGYAADIETIVRHATGKGVVVLLSLWHDPSIDAAGRPTQATAQRWAAIAERFVDEPRVMFGLVNEPIQNYDGAEDAVVWAAMSESLAAIRAVEDAHGVPHHVVVAQGTGGWARFVDYYTTHPLPGDNVAYEVHAYNPASDFASLVAEPAATIPVIIGEFGPVEGTMTLDDADALVDLAHAEGIPYLAWTFHHNCAPNLLVDTAGGQCGIGMPLQPSPWGARFQARLAEPR